MNIYEKLLKIQTTIKVQKLQYNAFAKYKYRSLEDITEAVKPLLAETKATLTISDEPVCIGERVYIKAKATLTDTEDLTQAITNTAYAREQLTKKGSDESQITGAASSYARKYCLNGLFCIDDNKDADTEAPPKDEGKPPASKSQTNAFQNSMKQYAANYPDAYKQVLNRWELSSAKNVTDFQAQQGLLQEMEVTIKAMEGKA